MPSYKVFWYCKWAATACIILGIALRSAGVLQELDLLLSLTGSVLWGAYGFHTNNRALLVTSAVGSVMLLTGVLRTLA